MLLSAPNLIISVSFEVLKDLPRDDIYIDSSKLVLP